MVAMRAKHTKGGTELPSSPDEPDQRQFYTLLLQLSRALGYN